MFAYSKKEEVDAMRKTGMWMLGGLWIALGWGGYALAGQVWWASFPPVVVKTTPEAGTEVDAATTKEIRVVFSKPMMAGSWSWVQMPNASFPKMTGKPYFLPDQRTCVLSVALQPNTAYALWLNSTAAKNFKDPKGQSAVPYLLVFRTKK